MNIDLITQLDQILLLACKWAEFHEAQILQNGEPLLPHLLSDAKAAGVTHPDKVRILAVPSIPSPDHPLLKAACIQTGFLTSNTAGLTLRNGIYVKSNYINDRLLCVHELTHVAQYERLGSIKQFLKKYLQELIVEGYSSTMSMEQEADSMARKICDG